MHVTVYLGIILHSICGIDFYSSHAKIHDRFQQKILRKNNVCQVMITRLSLDLNPASGQQAGMLLQTDFNPI